MQAVLDFIGHTADGVYAVDCEQRIAVWNKAAESMLGHRSCDVLGRYCYEVIGGSDELGCRVCKRRCSVVRAALRLEQVEARDLRVRAKDGRWVWIDVSTFTMPERWSHAVVLVHAFRDITRRKDRAEPGPWYPRETSAGVPLTVREREVLGLLADGAPTDEIADSLHISRATVRNHIHHVLEKLGVHSRLEAVTYAMRRRVI